MRSRRPTRCSTTSGLHGRSNSTRRRQNSKLRPSPPHSVETSRLGPSGSRNCATSMSRRADGELLVEDARRELRAPAERCRAAARASRRWATKTSVFSPGGAPARRLRRQPVEARVGGVGAVRRGAGAPRRGALSSGRSAAPEASARRMRSAFCRRPSACGAGVPRTASTSSSRRPQPSAAASASAASSAVIGTPTRGGSPPMSMRRVELVQAGSGSWRASRCSKLSALGEVGGAQQLQQAEEPVDVVVERNRGEQQQVPARAPRAAPRRARRGLPGWPAGRRRRWASSTTSRSMPASTACCVSCGRATSVSSAITARRWTSNGLKSGPWSRATSSEPRLVEQDEDLVVLAPQLAQPLHGQRLGGDDQAALGAPRAQQAAQDQAGLDRLAEADLVGEQPAHRVAGRGALGGVELVGEEADAAAEKRAEPAGLAQRQQVQRVEAVGEVLERVEVAEREPLDEVARRCRSATRRRPAPRVRRRAAPAQRRSRPRALLLAGRGQPDAAPRAQVERPQRRRVGRQAQAGGRGAGTRPPAFVPRSRRSVPGRARGCGRASVGRRASSAFASSQQRSARGGPATTRAVDTDAGRCYYPVEVIDAG